MEHADNWAFDVEAVAKRVSEPLPAREQAGCAEFVRLFFHHYPTGDMKGRARSDIDASLHWLWKMLNAGGDLPRVEVFNPEAEKLWQLPHTLVVVHQKDMPFLVDSVRMELTARNIPIHSIKSTPFCAERVGGELVGVASAQTREAPAEALIYLEVGRISDPLLLRELTASIEQVLADVSKVVENFAPLKSQVLAVADALDPVKEDNRLQDVSQTQAFLRWLADDHFTFLAYAEFDLQERDGRQVLVENRSARLGLFDDASKTKTKTLDDAHPGVARFYLSPSAIAFSKSPQRSRVHRNAYPDYVVIKRYDSDGKVCGEARFLGLYTSSVYSISPNRIPLLQDKVRQIYERIGLNVWSHEGKALEQVIETFPRDELFQSSAAELYDTLQGVLSISERYQVRLFVHRDRFGKFVSCLVYVPRDLFSTRVRLKIQKHIAATVGACDEEFNTFFSESVLARVHLVFRIPKGKVLDVDEQQLEREVADLARSWEDKLFEHLKNEGDEERARGLLKRYADAFSQAYQEAYRAPAASRDIAIIERMGIDDQLAMDIVPSDVDGLVRLKLFYRREPLALSDVIPVLENFGLRVVSEHPYPLRLSDNGVLWLHDFSLAPQLSGEVDINASADKLKTAFWSVWQGKAENDAFNKLVLAASLDWQRVNMLRVYAAYMRQTLFHYAHDYIAQALVNQVFLAGKLCEYFRIKFDPEETTDSQQALEALASEISEALESVPDLSEDRIVRHYLALMQATVRCNFYQSRGRDYLALKLRPRELADVPEPKPLYEIFVYSVRFEGVHLRGSKVARGGLRWSDRLQDYRTEVLGLVKAQQVKNAVIVPSGAKGGFVCKAAAGLDRDARQEEGVACYRQFISALLDLTDNLVDGEVVAPEQLVRHDDDDPYLVVAADKGTASFSDIANDIAQQADFWLGDAFASGGSQGYDHKAMGITAKGGWVCVQRHFKERGVDIQSESISVLGIGDMGGDVFGNGMLLSRAIKLTAAFNHMHIFIDPNPDPEVSFAERERLFNLPRSQWTDYQGDLISDGGGIFERSAKSIKITAPMKERFGLTEDKLTPTQLIHQLLRAPVDLIWNGGIGTYVKSADESHAQVGDKANDGLRVDGRDLRCKVFGEGGNLGMTQRGRVEFCRAGGACNTDFIDNSAGVDCSDHEVNIKIALAELVKAGQLGKDERNQLLKEMTEEVATDVLQNNYRQAQAISLMQSDAVSRSAELRRFITSLESQGRLNRSLEFLPGDEDLAERHAAGEGLTRPELAVLMAYAKVGLKADLATEVISQDPSIAPLCERAFPATLQSRYRETLQRHRLREEIIATQLANEIVNYLGATFVQRMQDATGVSAAAVARAYLVARRTSELDTLWRKVEALDFEVDANVQQRLMKQLMRRMRRNTRWFLRNRRGEMNIDQQYDVFQPRLTKVHDLILERLDDSARENWQKRIDAFVNDGVPEPLATAIVSPGYLYSGLGIVDVVHSSGASEEQVAELYMALVSRLRLDGFAQQLSEARVETYWQAMAREAYMDDLESQVRSITATLVSALGEQGVESVVSQWAERHALMLGRWNTMVTHAQSAASTDYAMFAVALRELLDLSQVSRHREVEQQEVSK